MAINVFFITQVSDELGFTRWTWVPLLHSSVLDTVNSIAYSEIPANLVPASEAQIAGETSTCTLIAPWGGFADPFTEFFLGGGTSGTLLGALNGLNIVQQSFLQKSTADYGLGQEYIGPQLGYCVGTLYKEKVYTEVNAQNILNFNPLITSPNAANQTGQAREQLIWRSRFERFYLNHGVILDFNVLDKEKGKYSILIDTKGETNAVGDVDMSGVPDSITLNRRNNGNSVTFSIDEVRGSPGRLEIDITYVPPPEGPVATVDFRTNDYFRLSSSWLIQDPYMLDGLMNSISTGTLPNSGNQEFFRTDQNAMTLNGSVIGVYIRRRNLAIGDNVIGPDGPGVVTAARTVEEQKLAKAEEKKAEATSTANDGSENSTGEGVLGASATNSTVSGASATNSTVSGASATTTEESTEDDVTTQRVVKFVDVQYPDGTVGEAISVENVLSLDEAAVEIEEDETERTDFISATVVEDAKIDNVEDDPVFQPESEVDIEDFVEDLVQYFTNTEDSDPITGRKILRDPETNRIISVHWHTFEVDENGNGFTSSTVNFKYEDDPTFGLVVFAQVDVADHTHEITNFVVSKEEILFKDDSLLSEEFKSSFSPEELTHTHSLRGLEREGRS